MDKDRLLDQLLNTIRNLDGGFHSTLIDDNLSVEDKIEFICEDVIDMMTYYLVTLESIK